MGLQHLFTEACADLAYGLVFLRVGIVTSQEEGAVDICTLSLAVISSDHDEVERVTHTSQVILLELDISSLLARSNEGRRIDTHLQPIYTPPTWFVKAGVGIQHLDHEAFTSILHTVLKECLYLVRSFAVI